LIGFVVCSRCDACVHGSWLQVDACERGSVLDAGVTPVSLWPLITMSNLGVWSCQMLSSSKMLSLQLNHVVKLFFVISLHVIISYTCGVFYVLTLVIFLVYC
jgi:hypothetical protein